MTNALDASSATDVAESVRTGELDPVEVVAAALARIAAADPGLGAFVAVREDAAIEDARRLRDRDDLADLALAGVPVAIKDTVDVAGMPTRFGSAATDASPADQDTPIVARLREAGAVVVGKTRCPELELWATSDDEGGVARNPWDRSRSAGGSSGGSATAVAGGMVPLALAADGLGSVRIPAASCGLFGIKPGRGVAPQLEESGEVHWFGMSRYGPLATSVADAALMLDVMAGTQRFREPSPPQRPLRIAVSTRPSTPFGTVDGRCRDAVVSTARVLHEAGHQVRADSPPSRIADTLAATSRWLQGPSRDVDQLGLDVARLQPRTRTHLAAGRRAAATLPVEDRQVRSWRERALRFFERHDVLITPAMAALPPHAGPWHDRPWIRNVAVGLPRAEFTALWNLADFPAASVPAGVSAEGVPLGVMLIAPDGHEELVLSLASHLEQLAPWVRTAPAGLDRSPVR